MTATGDDDSTSGGYLTRSVVAEHHIVRTKNARIVALNLRFLNLNCLVSVALYEIVLTRRVGAQRCAVVRALLELTLNDATLTSTHDLDAARHLRTVTGSSGPFLSSD